MVRKKAVSCFGPSYYRMGGSMKLTRRVTLEMAVIALAFLTIPLLAQTQPGIAERRFEVASVKLQQQTLAEVVAANQGNTAVVFERVGIRTFPGGRLTAGFTTLRALILRAYNIKDYQLEGGPAWVGSSNFEINAKASGDATTEEFNAMLKALLIERFALRTRTESRQLPQYVLTVARSDGKLGPALKPTSAGCIAEMEARRQNPGQPTTTAGRLNVRTIEEMREMMRTPSCGASSMFSNPTSTTFSTGGMPLTNLVSRLSSELNAPVVDKTGLSGPFDVVLEYEPTRRPTGATSPAAVQDDFAPPLRSALQQQLGLKLEEAKGPVDVLIIESVEQPTPD